MADPLPVNLNPAPEPGGEFSFTQMIPTLVSDVAMPIVAFNVLTHYGVSTLWALVAGGLFPALNSLRVWIKSRKLEPLGIIVMSFLAVGTAASFLTATFGFICLGSLMAERPLMFYINRQFVAGDDPVQLKWWNGLWEFPHFRAAQRLVTTVWGIAYIVEALVRVGFAMVLSPAQVVAISPVMAFGVTVALIAWTRRYMLATRERRIHETQLSQAS
jgi:hypothetical protein